MKSSSYLFIFAICLLIVPASATNFTYHPNNVLYLPMNGTANSTSFLDLSSSAHTITPFGNAQVFTTPVKFGSGSLGLSKDGDYLTTASSSDFDAGIMTLSVWFNPMELSNATFSKYLYKRDTFHVHFDDQSGGTRIRVLTGSGSIYFPSAGITANDWNYLLLSYDGTNFVANVNGNYLGSQALAFPAITGSSTIGQGTVGEQNYIGYIDDFVYLKNTFQNTISIPSREYLTNPQANFNTNITAGDSPLAVQFTNVTNDAVTSHIWTFTDVAGNNTEILFSTSPNPLYIFGSVGNYSINYTVISNFGSSSAYSQVNSHPPQVASNFTYSPDTLYVGGTILFYDRSDDAPNLWYWNFGDGSTAYVQNPIHSYGSEGTYNVTMSASNSGASNTSISKNLIVHGIQDHDPIVVTNPYVVVYMWRRVS